MKDEDKDIAEHVKEKLIFALDWYKKNTTFANRSIVLIICGFLLYKFVPFSTGNTAPSQMAINPQPVATGSVVDPLENSQGRLAFTQAAEEETASQYRATLLANVEDYLSYRGNQFKLHIENIRRDNNLSDYKQAIQLAQKEQADRLAKLRNTCISKKAEARKDCQSKVDAEIGAALTELMALQLILDKQIDLGQINYKDQSEITFDPSNLVVDNERLREATADRVAANASYQDALVARTNNEQR